MSNNLVRFNSFLPSKVRDNKIFFILSVEFNYNNLEKIADHIKDFNEPIKYFIFSRSVSNSIKDKTDLETDIIISGLFRIKEDYGITVVSNFGSGERDITKRLKTVDIILIDSFNALNTDIIKGLTISKKPLIIDTLLLDKEDIYKIGEIAENDNAPLSFLFDDITIKYIDIYEKFFSFLKLDIFSDKIINSSLDLGIKGFFINVNSVEDVKYLSDVILNKVLKKFKI
ncbi:MAG TPA: hypothetical protein PKW55_03370 [Spirochaetota bacterium]|nr:hypothetical protein [Spirochaetota bacterium]HOM38125.1 hypothetical protein [Spirochaetota bacterium]HPQ48927.1 hypothetical protein [Spirochaetota bacterium]